MREAARRSAILLATLLTSAVPLAAQDNDLTGYVQYRALYPKGRFPGRRTQVQRRYLFHDEKYLRPYEGQKHPPVRDLGEPRVLTGAAVVAVARLGGRIG